MESLRDNRPIHTGEPDEETKKARAREEAERAKKKAAAFRAAAGDDKKPGGRTFIGLAGTTSRPWRPEAPDCHHP